jgi:hypothetical protein
MYEKSLAEYTVRAEQTGVVHLSTGLTVGTVLQTGSLLGSISPTNKESLYFETVVSAADRAKLKIGDTAETTVSGAMQSEFGILTGKVTHIDTDSIQTENGEVFLG